MDAIGKCTFVCANNRSPVGTGSGGSCNVAPGHIVAGGIATNGAATLVVRVKFPTRLKQDVLIPLEGTLHFQRQRQREGFRRQVMLKPLVIQRYK